MESVSQQSLRFGPDIQGYVQIKRKFFWVIRYAEIQNGVFYYYEDRGDTRPRGAFRISDCTVSVEVSSDGEETISIDVKSPNNDPMNI